MISLRLIRHAQSAANAGLPTTDPGAIPLTQTGQRQGLELADAITSAPDLIISSPYLRAMDTALPTASRCPDVPFEVWAVEEFTYLAPNRFAGTTQADRKPYVESYWSNGDAALVDGPGAESFEHLLGRARAMLARLADLDAQDVQVFSHGQFIRAVAWVIKHSASAISPDRMREFRAADVGEPLGNCCSYQLLFDGGMWTVEHRLDPSGQVALIDGFCNAPKSIQVDDAEDRLFGSGSRLAGLY
ncbi:histidine phosphatase family protein (plasmid) [Pseudomonas silesiensis]|uniref:histidine phosphatase family protein n=1 Tax=Pseudomonas silesiensis TaxID=1853130 RepID=UPI0030CBBA93